MRKKPGAFQLMTQLLRQDREKTALFILTYDLDLFDAEVPDFADATGISEADLRELADYARDGQDPGQAKVREQHLVSQVLLRRFSDRTANGFRMGRYSLRWGKGRPVSPESVAKKPTS